MRLNIFKKSKKEPSTGAIIANAMADTISAQAEEAIVVASSRAGELEEHLRRNHFAENFIKSQQRKK